jgi:hypothetical protein
MEFTTEQINVAIAAVLEQNKAEINNVISLSLFVSNVGKKLIGTINSSTLTAVQRVDIIADIGSQITSYLEEETLITFELAQQFREVLKNTDEFKQTIQAINNFVLADPEQKKTILSSFICGCINSILGPDRRAV